MEDMEVENMEVIQDPKVDLWISQEKVKNSYFRKHSLLNGEVVSTKSINMKYYKEEESHLYRCATSEHVLRLITTADSIEKARTPFKYLIFEPFHSLLFDFIDLHFNNRALMKSLCMDICKGLQYIHQKRIVHGAINPYNIVIVKANEHYKAKICNFDHSKLLEDGKLSLDPPGIHFEDVRADYGKLNQEWPSKEQLDNKSQGARMDVFNAGCVLFYCLTKEHPADSINSPGIKMRRRNIRMEEFPTFDRTLEKLMQWNVKDLLEYMIMNERAKIKRVTNHLFFWDIDKIIRFFQDASDFICSNRNLNSYLKYDIIGAFNTKPKWIVQLVSLLPKHVSEKLELENNNDYQKGCGEFVRLIRNATLHYSDMFTEGFQNVYPKEKFVNDILDGFPEFLPTIYIFLLDQKDFYNDKSYKQYSYM